MATFKENQKKRIDSADDKKREVIGEDEVREASERLKEYQRSKASIDGKATSNQEWWRLRHWNQISKANDAEEKSVSAWLFNSIINKHADIMDNFPKPNILPRQIDDEQDAKSLSEIVPVVLEQNKYRRTYSKSAYDFIVDGACVTGVFWDNSRNSGMGDVTIKAIDVHNIYWEPGKEDIQDCKEIFTISTVKNEDIIKIYPELNGKTGKDFTKVEYIHDDYRDDSDESVVVDWYYKVQKIEQVDVAEGVTLTRPVTVLHYCKFCNGVVLYASENESGMEDGFYHHGKYPFVVKQLFPIKDSPWGFGYVDVMRSPQTYIDALDQLISKNAFMSAEPRFWAREDAGINWDDFADWSKTFIRFAGGNIDEIVKKIEVPSVPAFVVNHKTNKIEELKETSGNRDFSQGSTQSGVTAASAIAALQEAGSKLARDMIRSYYDGFEEENYLIIELIRQFYDEPRSFRIDNGSGGYTFEEYSNQNMKNRGRSIFDIQVVAEKQSPFSRAAQNETVKELYGMGLFAPANAEPALVCLDAMEFEGKESIKQQIQENSLLMQQVQRMQQVIMQADTMLPQLQLAAQAGLSEPQAQQPQLVASKSKEEGTAEERAAKNDTDSTIAAKARIKAAKQAQVG